VISQIGARLQLDALPLWEEGLEVNRADDVGG
jgi:hypothetical protein